MAYDDDYTPVLPDEEDELKRGAIGGYAPVAPAPQVAGRYSSVPVAPEAGGFNWEPERGMSKTSGHAPAGTGEPRESVQEATAGAPPVTPRPQWKDYAPAEPHGWAKFGHIMAGLSPVTNLAFNVAPEQRAKEAYKNAVSEYEAPGKEESQTAETGLREEQTENLKSEEREREHPKPKPATNDFELWAQQNPNAPVSDWIKLQNENKPKTERPDTPEQQYIDEYQKEHPGASVIQAEQAFKRDTATPEKPQRVLGITPDHKVIEITPGMTLPPGTQTVTGEIKQEAAGNAGQDALNYANDYMAAKQFTGPGDEALMEKFFELAKPSSGFRMTQAQIEMLQHARDLMGSVEARAKHLFSPDAPYFSDAQRRQIVATMTRLENSKGGHKAAAQGGPATATDPLGILPQQPH